MNLFLVKLETSERANQSILCFGMDPLLDRMGVDSSKNLSDEIVRYFSTILYAIREKISAVKPNVAFYMQYGNEGMIALIELIKRAKAAGLPVIVDAKLGDIGRTSEAYARFVFETLGGDAVTLNPYLGEDALQPFFSYSDKGFFVLALTSNPGAGLLQFSQLDSGEKLYQRVIELICNWNKKLPSIGAVIGATKEEFERCITAINDEGVSLPLLIPGVGTQGGSYQKVSDIIRKQNYKREIVRINASSGISYAHERISSSSIDEAAFLACEEILSS
ncbi:MAG: orotidine-5'-phosphate decarboxylase [Spirochaetota bacterium]|nr:MAG: orotidine-5'-phosphate decarboxylase [Spirochaetota bacterium]